MKVKSYNQFSHVLIILVQVLEDSVSHNQEISVFMNYFYSLRTDNSIWKHHM